MWEFAAQHPVWLLVYLVVVCLTATIIAGSLFSTARYIFVDLLKSDEDEDEDDDGGDPDGGTRADPDEVSGGSEEDQKAAIAARRLQPLH
jgi:hypothetical protein